MSNIIIDNKRLPSPQRDRKDHEPAAGDVYFNRDRFIRIRSVDGSGKYATEEYDFLAGAWQESRQMDRQSLDEYYTLLLCGFDEIASIAAEAVDGNNSRIAALAGTGEQEAGTSVTLSSPAEQVLAVTEKAERIKDKLDSVQACMKAIIEQRRERMERMVRSLDKQIRRFAKQIDDLYKVITVMNLYTGRGVSLNVLADGAPAPEGEPIHIRQRILYMDEEYLADAENGGIDYQKEEEFYRWLTRPGNIYFVCPEPKCIVAMKPKRFNMRYSSNESYNLELNRWNHHTVIIIRNGERIFMLDSEDLELHGTAIPRSDQQEQFEKRYDEIMGRAHVWESDIERLRDESEALGYMYTKYISFLQGLIDAGEVFDLSAGRPNLAKGEGVTFVRDDENAVGTGLDWHAFQKSINAGIRRGTRVIYIPFSTDERGYEVSGGEHNRYYFHDASAPCGPDKGLYSVDYPSKRKHVKGEDGRYHAVDTKGDRLAIFYTPRRWTFYDGEPRKEAWLYNPWCVINYDALTVGMIDAFMADRTQRESFRHWMPLLQEARKRLLLEKDDEDAFVNLLCESLLKEHPSLERYHARTLIRESVAWWKGKVIFTRPLRSDDARAWRMIKGETVRRWKKENQNSTIKKDIS